MSVLGERIKDIKIDIDATLLHALKQMDKTGKRLLLVYQNNNKFKNLISVGDIQRAIINNLPLESPIRKVLRKDAIVATPSHSSAQIKELMIGIRAELMPVLDEDGNLVDVHFWEEMFPKESNKPHRNLSLPVVIMAGGKGTRMKPLTNILPKALIPVGENTILEQIMDRFIRSGCHNFHLSVNYKSHMIKYYLGSNETQDYKVSYFEEDKPLGTAGSLFMLKGVLNSSFFISNCDILIEEDYGEIYDYHKANQNDLTIVAALKHYSIPYGTIETVENGLLKVLNEKPELTFQINSGMYIMEPHLLNEIPENTFYHITDLIDKIKENGSKIGVFPVSEKSWKDIGNWQEYQKEIVSDDE